MRSVTRWPPTPSPRSERREETEDNDDANICGGCGGLYRFDTSVPSPLWNAVIRANGGSEYLCTACIVRAFAKAKVSFTATLWGDGFSGEGIVVTYLETPHTAELDDLRAEVAALRAAAQIPGDLRPPRRRTTAARSR